jgi:AmmeMemoRadiSam system protein A
MTDMADVYLPADSQRRLIGVSRKTLEDFVCGRATAPAESNDPCLETKNYGAFVTLFKNHELRGCVGSCAALGSLWRTVIEMTQAAASRDRRMEPIQHSELADIRIDISVLSQFIDVDDPLLLEPGEHGLYVGRKGKRGVLLPQVAVERGWDMQTFLEQTCVKADLPKNAWRWTDTRVRSFTALIIVEKR